jgi:hypothetical protein
MPIETYTATSKLEGATYTVTIDKVRVNGKNLEGTGTTRDAAAFQAKRALANHLRVYMHELALIVDGGH